MATDPTWLTDDTRALLEAIVTLDDVDEAADFLRDLCTLGELRDMSQRWAVVRLLDAGHALRRDLARTGASTATITRIASWLHHGEGGYRRMLDRLAEQSRTGTDAVPVGHRAMRDRLRLAVPNKGRLVEPTLALLHDAGLVFEEHDRSLVARVQNLDLDILFVRTNDVIEFVGDGVADLGVTGVDLLAETGSDLPVVRELGYGRCRLAAAVPTDSSDHDGRGARRARGSRRPTRTRPAGSSRSDGSRST